MSHTPAALAIYLLGPPRLERNGQPVVVDTRKAIALLAYLALHPERLSRDQIAALLWPEYDQERAYANLRRTLWALNKAIGEGWVLADNLTLQLQPQAALWIDMAAFQRLLAQCRDHGHRHDAICPACLEPLGQAVQLVRGDFLEGFSLRDSAPFDDWHFFEAESLRKTVAATLEKLVQEHNSQQEDESAITYARRWLALDPLHEPAHRWLMQLYAQASQPAAAIRQYQECVRVLKAELDAPPEAETTALYHRIRSKQIGRRPAKPAPITLPVLSVQESSPPPAPPPAPPAEDQLRMVTVLCAALTEPLPAAQSHPSEQSAQRMQRIFQVAETILLRYEGRVERLLGEGVVALFGAQQQHEDDPERAVRAALELRQAAQQAGLQMSAGISSGHVYLSQQGTDTITNGPVVTLALRLQNKADSDQLLVSEAIYRQTRGVAIYTPLSVALQSQSKPLAVYQIERLHPYPQKVRGIAGLHAPLVGRSKELAALQAAIATLQQGEGQLITLIGEAGLGKSRLVSEVKENFGFWILDFRLPDSSPVADAQSKIQNLKSKILWLEGRCLEMSLSASYWPFLDILRAYLGWQPEESEANRAGRIVTALDGLVSRGAVTADQREEMAPLLGNLLSVRFGNAWDERLTFAGPEQIRHQTLIALRDLFVALTQQQPVVLVLEDLHWADSLSLDLITLLMETLAEHPLFLLCVYRPERQHRCWQLATLATAKCPDHFTEVRLRELTTRQSQHLVETLLNIENLPPKVKTTILQKAQGNPLFVEEVIRSLIDAGIVYCQGEVWRAKEEIENVVVPETVQRVILSRVDRLGEPLKGFLQRAAVIGRLFDRRLLAQLTPAGLDLDNAISTLTTCALIYQERVTPEAEYSFKHVLVQEAIYQNTLHERRQQFHRQVGEALEQLYANNLAERYEQLAYHYDRSGVVEKAIEYLLKAVEKAQATFANDLALDYYAHLLPLVTEPVEQVDLHLQWGVVLEHIGRWEEAETHCHEALTCAIADPIRKAHCQSALGKLCYLRGDYSSALNWLEQAREGWVTLNDRAGLAQTLIEIGLLFLRKGEYATSRQYTEEGVVLMRRIGDQSGIARALNTLGSIVTQQGDSVAARVLYEESLALAQEVGDRPSVARTLYNLGMVSLIQGDNMVARVLYSESLALAREMGDVRNIAVVLGDLGMLAHNQGDLTGALALCEEGLALARKIGDMRNIAARLCSLGLVAYDKGKYTSAQSLYEEGLALARKTGDTQVVIWTLRCLGDVAAQLDDLIAARALYEESLALARKMDNNLDIPYPLVGLAGLAVQQGDNVVAWTLYEEGLTLARKTGDKQILARTLRCLGDMTAQQGNCMAARALYEESLTLTQEVDDKCGIIYTLVGLSRLDLGNGINSRAVRLAAASETLRTTIHMTLEPKMRHMYDETVASARATLGKGVFAQLWAEGQTMALEEAIELAMEKVNGSGQRP